MNNRCAVCGQSWKAHGNPGYRHAFQPPSAGVGPDVRPLNAIHCLLSRLRDANVSAPEVFLEDDGEVAFDWTVDARATLTASLNIETYRVGYAFLIGDSKGHGSFYIPADWPLEFKTALERLETHRHLKPPDTIATLTSQLAAGEARTAALQQQLDEATALNHEYDRAMCATNDAIHRVERVAGMIGAGSFALRLEGIAQQSEALREDITTLQRERDEARRDLEPSLERANAEIGLRQQIQIAYTLSEQKRLQLIIYMISRMP